MRLELDVILEQSFLGTGEEGLQGGGGRGGELEGDGRGKEGRQEAVASLPFSSFLHSSHLLLFDF